MENPDPAWADTVVGMVHDHERLERLIRDLLLLARHDDHEPIDAEPVDLGYLVRTELQKRPTVAGLTIHVRAENVLVNGSSDALLRVLRNLVDNAERHARSRIDVSVTTDPSTSTTVRSAELVVHDDGPGIPVEYQAIVFERFRRLDDARAAEAGGSGLGLSIVSDVVHAHGGTVVVAPSEAGARFVVRIPALQA